MDTWDRLEAGLPTLGRIHSLLQGFKVSKDGRNAPASNNISPKAVLDGTARGRRRIREWNPTPIELRLAASVYELAVFVDYVRKDFSDLPHQLVHGDYWDNNVFFSDGQVALVADFDFMGERARIDDLALTLYYTNSTFSDDQTSDARIHQLLHLVDAYDSGLDAPLSRVERAALPIALARAPLAFIAMLPAIDSEAGARQLAAEMHADIAWALAIASDLDRWQSAFTGRW
jgi:homoserine kinase type II